MGRAKSINLSGQKINNWEVLSLNYSDDKNKYWLCVCNCGNVRYIRQSILLSSKQKKCRKCTKITHGFTHHPLYKKWQDILYRCYNSNCKEYKWYGDKGVVMCDEWKNNPKSFIIWCIQHGWKNDLTIDRIDNDGNYEPSNCWFITRSENSKRLSYDEKIKRIRASRI